MLIFVDETYAIEARQRIRAHLEAGGWCTTDFFAEGGDGILWWFGRRGSWRAGRHGEEPREVDIVGHRAEFGDLVITFSEEGAGAAGDAGRGLHELASLKVRPDGCRIGARPFVVRAGAASLSTSHDLREQR